MIRSEEVQAIEVFKKHTEKEGNWEQIKKNHLKPGLDENATFSSTELKALVKYRDIIDFKMYRKAVENIFPTEAYNLETRVNGSIENRDGHPRFVADWYEFKVTKRAQSPLSSHSTSQCIIRVNAPGSRNLTSDIDTSLFTTIQGDAKDLLENANPKIKVGLDYAGRITASMIDGFYDLSEKEFGMTSGEHRDSNAYADLSTEDNEEYPKFQNNETRNPKIGDKPLFDENEFNKKSSAWKLRKHQLELSASLFSLRMALGADKWKTFVDKQVSPAIKEYSDILNDGTPKGLETAQNYINTVNDDIAKVFELTEKLYSRYESLLTDKKQKIAADNKAELEKKAKERDIEIAALNRLYVESLEEMVKIKDNILILKQQNDSLIKGADIIFEEIQEEEKKFAHFSKEQKLFAKEIEECKRKCSERRKQYEEKIKTLKDNYMRCADLELQRLEVRYQAHTFANEAYVCRSAVYHVVSGMQQSGTLNITEQTLLSSALQQIGFKLLHTQELEKRKKLPGEIAYRTAKYSQRVHNLLFHQSQITDEAIKADFKSRRNKLNMFFKFKTEGIRSSLFTIFSLEELLLLNSEMKIILDIKNKTEIPEQEKYQRTEVFLNSAPPRPEAIFLSLASKLIVAVYLSKFERRPKLWSEVPAVPQKQIAPLYEKSKDVSKDIKLNADKDMLSQEAEEVGALVSITNTQLKRKLEIDNTDEMGKKAKTNLSKNTIDGDAVIRNINKRPT